MKLAYAFCGSFCTHAKALDELELLAEKHDITPVFSEITAATDTRFGTAEELHEKVNKICNNEIIKTIKRAEEVITKGKFDAVIVAPCTGNTLAKIASGITDSTVTMSVKAQLRNRRPVIIALATNDGLSANLFNIAMTLEKKNIYFVPFGQDNAIDKPTSLICNFDKIEDTLELAIQGKQLQPLLL
ncbi:MAG: dipicolinate synthase subunit B [Clostridiales bacterium GWF2_36_10]|nr:MAG: dipicolinate synthase subunit B [Clostridiales bacterium GWF2_36_10]HAN20461.1 dipicolinate synthase subunit B [Clostridiales bacterium]